ELSCRHARRRSAGPRATPRAGRSQGGSGKRLPLREPAGGAAPRRHGSDRRDRREPPLPPPDGAGDGAGRYRAPPGAIRGGGRAGGGDMSGADYTMQGAVAVIRLDNPPVNGLGHPVRAGILTALDRANADPAVSAVVLLGAGKAFSAGADINELGTPRLVLEPALPTVIREIERSAKPVIAAMHGLAMGGGLELALGCHYGGTAPGAQIALPEGKLGWLPGAGATQRLPRDTG